MIKERIVEAMIEHAIAVELNWDDDKTGYPFDVSEQMMQNLRNRMKRELKLTVQHLNMSVTSISRGYLSDPLIKKEIQEFMNKQNMKETNDSTS